MFLKGKLASANLICFNYHHYYSATSDPRNAVPTEIQLSEICEDVGNCWSAVGPLLGIPKSIIYNINEEWRRNRDKANAILNKWKQKEGHNATVASWQMFWTKWEERTLLKYCLVGKG